jgi:hypothetical protein
MMVAVSKLREEKLKTNQGMRGECLTESVPLFYYFSELNPDLDCFGVCLNDLMHNLFLGLYKQIGKVLATQVISCSQASQKHFKSIVLEFYSQKIDGIEGTFFRPRDMRATSKTDLLHLLEKGSLYEREYKEIGPLFAYIFHPAFLKFKVFENANDVISSLTDLIWMCTFVQSRFWPVEGVDSEWWNQKRDFFIECFRRFQVSTQSSLVSKEKNLIKIHELICHVWSSLRKHGSWIGTDGLEGLFHIFKSMTTNYKKQGAQIFQKFFSYLYSSRWVLGSDSTQIAVRCLIDKEKKKQKPGVEVLPSGLQEKLFEFFGHKLFRPLKWLELETSMSGIQERGVKKIFACQNWHNRKKYSCIRFEDGSYFLLNGICEEGNQFYGIGKELENVDLRKLPFHYRFPVLFDDPESSPKVKLLKVDELEPICLLPLLGEADKQLLLSIHENATKQNVFYHHIFITSGSYRNQQEKDWTA